MLVRSGVFTSTEVSESENPGLQVLAHLLDFSRTPSWLFSGGLDERGDV